MEFEFTLVIFSLFIAEQLAMIRLGSYPYFWGLPVTRRTLPSNLRIENLEGTIGRIRIKKDREGNIFIRHKHFPLTWGPYVFVGQAKKEDPTELIIRLGPLTCLFFITFILQGLFQSFYSTVVSLVTVVFFCGIFPIFSLKVMTA
jgi:hypothetical protein